MVEVEIMPASIKLSDFKAAKLIFKNLQPDTFCKVLVDKPTTFRAHLSLLTKYSELQYKTIIVDKSSLYVFCIRNSAR